MNTDIAIVADMLFLVLVTSWRDLATRERYGPGRQGGRHGDGHHL